MVGTARRNAFWQSTMLCSPLGVVANLIKRSCILRLGVIDFMISQVTIQNFKHFKAPTAFVLKPDEMTFLAGGNNSGKSTLLQALAVWEFVHSVIAVNKGEAAWLAGSSGQGVGVSTEEFSPIAIPDLKHLWSDLKASGGATGNG